VMCEMLIQVCHYAHGLSHAVALGGRDGQLELNVTLPMIAHCLHEAIHSLTSGVTAFSAKCVAGLEVDADRCRELVERSLMLATALNPHLGYDRAAEVAREAWTTGRTLRDVLLERRLLDEATIDRLLDPRTMTRPGA